MTLQKFWPSFPIRKTFSLLISIFTIIHRINQDWPSSFGKVWLFFWSVDSTSLVDSVEVNWGWLSNIRPHFFHEILSLFFSFQVSTDIYWVWLSKSFNKVRRNFFTWNSRLDSARRASTRFTFTKNASWNFLLSFTNLHRRIFLKTVSTKCDFCGKVFALDKKLCYFPY